MFGADTLKDSSAWADTAMARLRELNLPATPENFTLFYAFTAGKEPELSRALSDAVREDRLDPRTLEDLYSKFYGFESERKALSETNASIHAELAKVVGMLSESSEGAGRFNETLENFTGNLKAEMNIDQLRLLVGRVAAETKHVAEQNQKLQEKLSVSTQQMSEMQSNLEMVRKEALVDPLTEIGNRKHFNNELSRTTREASEFKSPLALLMIDIDFFKKFNDTHGHLVGDQVLRLVARTLRDNLKGKDVLARYGGEEFAILLTNTKLSDALRVADLLRISVGNKKITRKPTGESLGIITLSIGVTEYVPDEALNDYVQRADAALYQAKAGGRNQAKILEPGAPIPEMPGAKKRDAAGAETKAGPEQVVSEQLVSEQVGSEQASA